MLFSLSGAGERTTGPPVYGLPCVAEFPETTFLHLANTSRFEDAPERGGEQGTAEEYIGESSSAAAGNAV
jgi:hypothetical protein